MLGILLIDKPLGCTSHDVVNDIRRRFHTKRVGHAGTLDPLATGLLVVAVGPATRFLQYLPLEPKEYVAEITFGSTTTTFDREGEVTSEGEVPEDLRGAVEKALPQFMGLIQQIPPMYSAVKVDGKALYKYARAGSEVVREPRNVHIGAFEVLEVSTDSGQLPNASTPQSKIPPKGNERSESGRLNAHSSPSITARIVCSGGTYIRTLAHDLGQAVGCGAHLSALNRTKVGRFELDQANPLDQVSPAGLLALEQSLGPMPMLELSPQQILNVREGRQIGVPDIFESPLVGLVEPGFGVFSVARVHGNLLQPECVIPSEAMHGVI